MNKNLKTFIYGIYAGLAIALGGFLNILSKTFFGDAGKIVGSLLFPIGLTLVCFLSLNLFTGKIGYFFDNKKTDYSKFLLLVYLGNLVGSIIAGFICLLCFKNISSIYNVSQTIASNKIGFDNFLSGFKLLCGATLCGALVYLAVFLYKTMKNNVLKVIGIFVPIAIFVYFGFDHCVANMFYFTFAFSFSSFKSYLNIIIATLGNSLGAIAINSFVNEAKKLIKNKLWKKCAQLLLAVKNHQ